jgi:uncharacterized protein (DUF952 family)
MRWLYHLRLASPPPTGRYAPASFASEGFIHASFRDDVLESARLHFPAGASLEVLRIDPRRLDVRVEVVATPRGHMPHIHGSIPVLAIIRVMTLAVFEEDLGALPDKLTG